MCLNHLTNGKHTSITCTCVSDIYTTLELWSNENFRFLYLLLTCLCWYWVLISKNGICISDTHVLVTDLPKDHRQVWQQKSHSSHIQSQIPRLQYHSLHQLWDESKILTMSDMFKAGYSNAKTNAYHTHYITTGITITRWLHATSEQQISGKKKRNWEKIVQVSYWCTAKCSAKKLTMWSKNQSIYVISYSTNEFN